MQYLGWPISFQAKFGFSICCSCAAFYADDRLNTLTFPIRAFSHCNCSGKENNESLYVVLDKYFKLYVHSFTLSVHQLPLELSQSFVKNIDGTYSRFHCPDPLPQAEPPEGLRTDRSLPIRPMELRTFLRVGKCLCSLVVTEPGYKSALL